MRTDSNYNEWLRTVKGMLLSTGYFESGLELHRKSWRPLFDDGYTPYQAVQIDFGGKGYPAFGEAIPVSIYWESFLEAEEQEA